jgi:hypothetical protein
MFERAAPAVADTSEIRTRCVRCDYTRTPGTARHARGGASLRPMPCAVSVLRRRRRARVSVFQEGVVMWLKPTTPMRPCWIVLVVLAWGAVSCGGTDNSPTAPTSTTGAPTRSSNNPTAAANPTPAPSPSPTPGAGGGTGRIQITISPSPVPFSGQPITDIASCRDRPNTWFYDQTLRETGGVAVTVTQRVDSFDGVSAAPTNPSLRIAANGSMTIRTRWCSVSSSAHTAQSNFSGTDANGRSWSVTGPIVRLQAR